MTLKTVVCEAMVAKWQWVLEQLKSSLDALMIELENPLLMAHFV